ncbi:MAG: lysine--tRNA ligase [Candidatus Ryanbacteria bacterium]|nr:lysine--tRNA ligase [Candidatus Ryanbacteria bacterium]
MFWADRHAEEIKKRFGKRTSPLIVRDEKTASGRVHIGSMRGVAIHGTMAEVLAADGVLATFLYEINDFDPMDGIPSELDSDVWAEHLGKPLCRVPSPDGKAKNFAEYYADEFKGVIAEAGFKPEYYHSSELYTSGKMNGVIRDALDAADRIRAIYKEVSGSVKKSDWLPISVLCEQCGKIGTTEAHNWDGEKVSYICTKGPGGSVGCQHKGSVAPWDGAAKLPWKVEWPAKWKVVGVDIEGAGKDHSTKGGAREVSDTIAREVFGIESPYDIPYEFFLDRNGKKMSSSAGRGASSREIADNFSPTILRLALIGKEPAVQVSIDPSGELLALLYDWHDRIASAYWDKTDDNEARLFEVLYHGAPPQKIYYPRFSTVTFVAQMQHLNIEEEFKGLKESVLTAEEKKELQERIVYARRWLERYAPDKYRFVLAKDAIPDGVKDFSDTQKKALRSVLTFVEQNKSLIGADFHAKLHEIKEQIGIAPKELFSALYIAFLGRDSGPQAGWFLSTIDRDFLIARLKEVS